MKKTIFLAVLIINSIILQAQFKSDYTAAFDSIFSNISRTEATMEILAERNEPENKMQMPYKTSIGGIMPFTSLAFGPSLKFFFTEHLAFQADIFIKGVLTGGVDLVDNKTAFVIYLSIESNINVMYQKKIKEKNKSELFWLMGGGVSLGYCWTPNNGKFGTNVILGLEYILKNTPMAIQIDFRPGYGLLFNSDHYISVPFSSFNNPWHHFDWFIGGTLRYTLKKK